MAVWIGFPTTQDCRRQDIKVWTRSEQSSNTHRHTRPDMLLVFLSDLAVLLFSIVLMYMCTLLYYWTNRMMMMMMMTQRGPSCRVWCGGVTWASAAVLNWTDLQQVDPVTRRVHWSRASASPSWLAAAKPEQFDARQGLRYTCIPVGMFTVNWTELELSGVQSTRLMLVSAAAVPSTIGSLATWMMADLTAI